MGRIKTIVLQACHEATSCHIIAQLQDCLTHAQEIPAVFFWVIGSPSGELLGEDPTGSLTTRTNDSILTLLRMIPQPVVGVALGCIGRLPTNMLRMCDYVVADNCSKFLAGGEQYQMSADEAIREGLAQIVMKRKDLFVQCESMFHHFQLHTLETSTIFKQILQSRKQQAGQAQLPAPSRHFREGQPPYGLPNPWCDPQLSLGASQVPSAVSPQAGGPVVWAPTARPSHGTDCTAADEHHAISQKSKVEKKWQRSDRTFSESSSFSSDVLPTIFEEDDQAAMSNLDAWSVMQSEK